MKLFSQSWVYQTEMLHQCTMIIIRTYTAIENLDIYTLFQALYGDMTINSAYKNLYRNSRFCGFRYSGFDNEPARPITSSPSMLNSSYQSILIAASSAGLWEDATLGVVMRLSPAFGESDLYGPLAGVAGEMSSISCLSVDCDFDVAMLLSANRRSRAVRSSKHRKNRSRTQFSRSHDFCSSFNPRRHSLALCSANFRAVPVTRPK